MSDDLISRQAAIAFVDCGYLRPPTELAWSDKDVVDMLKRVPSAQPEIIHCGDCKYKDDGIDEDGIPFLKCLNGRSYGGTRMNDYCSWAERRQDE